MLVIAYLLNSGAYDLFVQAIQKFCIKDPTVTEEKWEWTTNAKNGIKANKIKI